MLAKPVNGQRVVCCDPQGSYFGWLGIVRGWNSANVGVVFDDDPDPPATGRWLRKQQVVLLADADAGVRKRIEELRQIGNLRAKAREAALLAVQTYNNPSVAFRSGGYIVLMVIAWTSAFLAYFLERGTKPYYRKPGSADFELIGGRPKCWELEKSVTEFFGERQSAVRSNLECIAGLRHRIEHSYMPEIDLELFPECQALLLNFEDFVAREFGEQYLLTDTLVYSLQFSRKNPEERAEAMRSIVGKEATEVLDWVERFRMGLSPDIRSNLAYSFRVFMIPQRIANQRRETVAMEWVDFNPEDPEAMAQYDQVVGLLYPKQVPVANMGLLKPTQVIAQVQAALPGKRFRQHEHLRCWRHYGVRPTTGSTTPEACNPKYCCYDTAHRDYLYTPAWVKFLVSELADDAKYQAICGKPTTTPDREQSVSSE